MLHQFRRLYPQGSLISELIDIERGLYIVKVSVQNEATILGTGLAAAETIEKAEDKARERALMTINLEKISTSVSQAMKTPLPSRETDNKNTTSSPQVNNNYSSPSFSPSVSETVISSPSVATEPEIVLQKTEFVPEPIPEENSPEPTPMLESQTNIFDQPITSPPVETISQEIENTAENTVELDFNEIRHKIDLEMKRLSWTKEQGRDYLLSTYGKRSRLHLTDEELLEFWHYLENLPS